MDDVDVVGYAVAACPFLHKLAERHGEVYARNIATRPCEPAHSSLRRPLLEEVDDLQHTFTLFHGPSGVVPLVSTSGSSSAGGCPFKHAVAVTAEKAPELGTTAAADKPPRASVPSVAPMASISLAFGGPNFGDFLFKHLRQHMQSQRRASHARSPDAFSSGPSGNSNPGPAAPSSGSSSAGFSADPPPGPSSKRPSSGAGGPARGPKPSAAAGSGSATSRPAPAAGSGPPSLKGGSGSAAGASAAASNASCPLRKWLGPYAGLVFNQYDKLQCPQAIVAARAALARTPPVKALRPQAIEVKLLAVGAAAALLNIPCGMWREHTVKFSAEWILAVHATIPLVAMLRKAVIMPKYAIFFTIGAAVAGQLVGSRLERRRMQQQLGSSADAAQGSLPAVTPAGTGSKASAGQLGCTPAGGSMRVADQADRGLLAAALQAYMAANNSSNPGSSSSSSACGQQVCGLGVVLEHVPVLRC